MVERQCVHIASLLLHCKIKWMVEMVVLTVMCGYVSYNIFSYQTPKRYIGMYLYVCVFQVTVIVLAINGVTHHV